MSTELLLPDKENSLKSALGMTEKSAIERFYENPCQYTFRKVLKQDQTPDMVRFAVENDGYSIRFIFSKLITYELCEIAVKQNSKALSYVPEKFKDQNLCELAVENDGLALNYVPGEWITPQLAFQAVSQNGLAIEYVPKRIISYKLAFQAVNQKIYIKNDFKKYPISYIPRRLLKEELLLTSITNSPDSIRDIAEGDLSREQYYLAVSEKGTLLKIVPSKYRDEEMIGAAIASEPLSIEYIPYEERTEKQCLAAFEANPFVFRLIPERFITREMCLALINASCNEDISRRLELEWIPDLLRNDRVVIDSLIQKIGAKKILDWNQEIFDRNRRLLKKIEENGEDGEETVALINPLSEDTVNYLLKIVYPLPQLKFDEAETPPPHSKAMLIKAENNRAHIYNLAINDDAAVCKISYITDLHLEHQLKDLLDNGKADYKSIDTFLDEKIQEMASSVQGIGNYLLIGGDVGHTKELVTMFYQKLMRAWNGRIIFILGNHELWDNHPEGIKGGYISRPLEEIVDDYRNRINHSGWNGLLLQNEVFINYKNRHSRVISEEQILNAADEDLRGLLSKSTFILLGGIGFSGFNQRFNAEAGLYRSAVTTVKEDRALSNRFKRVYDKINHCAGDKQVIVLTHNPVYDWTNEPCNPNWIYINGHTHQNSLIREQDGTTILSDNQIGYKPIKWKLNAFTISGWYDPFRDMDDGIHPITSEQYKDFNIGRGIRSNGCNFPGTIYVFTSIRYRFMFA